MQEALTGAGQKIRGSVLIEQQVRNMMYGVTNANNRNDEEVIPTCDPISVERAYELVIEIFKRVELSIDRPLSNEISPVFVHAKKTDPFHYSILCLVYRFVEAAIAVREEFLGTRVSIQTLMNKVHHRVHVKEEYLKFLNLHKPPAVGPESPRTKIEGHRGEIFKQVTNISGVILSSQNPKQLKLVNL
jgi:hypothetical protein